jgi:hypothetical protein
LIDNGQLVVFIGEYFLTICRAQNVLARLVFLTQIHAADF